MSDVRVASAPVSFGVFRQPAEDAPAAVDVLDVMAEAGYAGTELGPIGYLGDGDELRVRLDERGLALVGAYTALRLSEPDGLGPGLGDLERTLDALEAAGAADARPLLADAGSPERRAHVGRAAGDRSLELGERAWQRLVDGLARADELCRERGFVPTFHHHAGTFVETPREIELLLDSTAMALTLDTGHLALGGGGSLLRRYADWYERVDHVHLKDVRLAVVEAVARDRGGLPELWRRGAFCPLGEGDVELEEFLPALRDAGYGGWVVVEQDRIPPPGEELAHAADLQAQNREWLRERGV